jgi:hypothetical protein
MFGEEKSLAMELKPPPPTSSSLPNAPSASNASYAAYIPAADFPGYGQMIRYWVTATTARSSLSGDDGARLLKSYARKPRREEDAYGAVVDAAISKDPPGCPLIQVANTRAALGRLAAGYRSRFDLPVIAVGGSNGKTSTKELVAGVLRQTVGTTAVFLTVSALLGVGLLRRRLLVQF